MKARGRCDRCESEFLPGQVSYVMNVESFADVGFELDDSEEQSASGGDIDALLDQLDEKEEEELNREVHDHCRLVLCKGCRDSITASLRKIQDRQTHSPQNQVH